jgi:DNA invertase Pin-like site-specific DNA recombinase
VRVIAYVRVSTDSQGESGAGLAAQRSAIHAEVARRGWELVEVLEDAGYSGRDFKRPALMAAMAMLERGGAAALMVAKLDRLSRSMLDFATVMEKARKENWGLIALDCSVDTTTPAGEAMANVMATFAQYERQLGSLRTSAALREMRSQGRAYGSLPYGWDREGDRLVVCDIEQRALAHIKRLRRRGHSYARIAGTLNRSGVTAKRGGVWHAMSVRSTLLTSPKVGRIDTEVAA